MVLTKPQAVAKLISHHLMVGASKTKHEQLGHCSGSSLHPTQGRGAGFC